MTYTPEQRAADAEIAKATGWTEVAMETGSFPRLIGVPPSGNEIHIMAGMGRFREIPRFHESHEARAALLIWVEQQSLAFRRKFLGELSWGLGNSLEHGKPTDEDEVFSAMLATPAQVAEAALKVIQENNK